MSLNKENIVVIVAYRTVKAHAIEARGGIMQINKYDCQLNKYFVR